MSFKAPFGNRVVPPSMNPSMPIIASSGGEDEEIRLLTDQLQLELGNLASTHSVLEADMQRLASMLGPYMTAAGRLNLPEKLDPKVLMFKQGLDFRIAEYNEDCRRLENIQERLQRKLEEAAGAYERTFMGASGLADARIIRRLEELQRIIQVQQQELDQTRFERDVVADEAKRLRQMFVKNGAPAGPRPTNVQEPFSNIPNSLHTITSAKFVPMAGPMQSIHATSIAKPPYMASTGLPSATRQAPPFPSAQPGGAADSGPAEGWGSWWTGQPMAEAPTAGPPAGGINVGQPPVARRDFI